MKKLKLRCWVKVVIIIILLLIIVLINNKYTEKDVKKCESLGYSTNYCYYHLG